MSTMPSTKDRILASAMQLLNLGGPGAVTLRAVGEATGVSAAAPYRHYEDKRALLEAMVRANLAYFNAALDKARRDAASPFAALDRLVRAYFDFARRFPVRYRFLLEASHEESPLGTEVREILAAVAALVRDAQQSHEIEGGDPDQISALILGAACGMANMSQHVAATAPRDRIVQDPPPDLAPLLLALLAGTSATQRAA